MAKKKKQDTPNAAPTSQSIGDVALAGLKKFKEEEEERIKFTVMPQRLVAARKDSAEALNQMREQKQLIKYQKEDQNDVYFFLHKKLDDNYDIIAELEAQLLKEELDRKKQEEKILKEIDEDNKSFKESSAGLKERLTAVDEKLYALKETDGTKSSMEKKMHHLLNDLESERKVSERSERALMKTSILAMNPANWLPTAASTTQLTTQLFFTRYGSLGAGALFEVGRNRPNRNQGEGETQDGDFSRNEGGEGQTFHHDERNAGQHQKHGKVESLHARRQASPAGVDRDGDHEGELGS